MKRYAITVNGVTYDVTVDEAGDAPMPAAAPAAPAAAPAAPAAAAPAPIPGGSRIESPMPGTILDVKVAVGQTVARGAVMVLLEAMKMENEICAPEAGKVLSVSVKKGDTVETGTLMVVLG